MTHTFMDELWSAVERLAREKELERRLRLRRVQERATEARGHRLVFEPMTPLSRAWARYDLDLANLR